MVIIVSISLCFTCIFCTYRCLLCNIRMCIIIYKLYVVTTIVLVKYVLLTRCTEYNIMYNNYYFVNYIINFVF